MGRPPFAEWDLCRVPWHSAKPSFAESQDLPSALFCRVRHSAKYFFAECPDKKHSAKSQALGKVQFSSSVPCVLYHVFEFIFGTLLIAE